MTALRRIRREWRELREEEPDGYGLIKADPPWSYRYYGEPGPNHRGPERHYPTMTVEEVAALPVRELAAKDCILFLWTTWPLLMDVGAKVLPAWGFEYVTGGAWMKANPARWDPEDPETWKLQIGGGYRLRSVTEPFIIGKRGSPRVHDRGVVNGIIESRREHSRKPEGAYGLAARLVAPTAPRLELFARQARPRWRAWGNQTDLFPPLSEAPPALLAAE